MKKLIYVCDRCTAEIKGDAKVISILDIDQDGDWYGENPFDGSHFCGKCIAEIMATVTQRPEVKKRGRKPKGIYTKNAKAMLAKG